LVSALHGFDLRSEPNLFRRRSGLLKLPLAHPQPSRDERGAKAQRVGRGEIISMSQHTPLPVALFLAFDLPPK